MNRSLLVFVCLSSVAPLVHTQDEAPVQLPYGWYSGDTHEHIQLCDLAPAAQPTLCAPNSIEDILDDILARMIAQDLNVVSVLIWAYAGGGAPWQADVAAFDSLRALVENAPIASHSTAMRILQYGVETSGLACADIGHVIGLRVNNYNVPCGNDPLAIPCAVPCENPPCCNGPGLDLTAIDSMTGPNCFDEAGIASQCNSLTHDLSDPTPDPYNNDGSTDYPAHAIAMMRATNPNGAVFGYAHQSWSRYLQWPFCPPYCGSTKFADTGQDFANWTDWLDIVPPPTDVKCLGTSAEEDSIERLLAIPNVVIANQIHQVPLIPVDVVLRRIDFLEAASLLTSDGAGYMSWAGAYYKLLNASQRVSVSAGTDTDCRGNPKVRTAVYTEESLSYDSWVDSLKAGRTSLSNNPGVFLRLEMGASNEFKVGDQVDLDSPSSGAARIAGRATFYVTSGTDVPLNDRIEIVLNGEVVWTATEPLIALPPEPVGMPPITWAQEFPFELDITKSCWIAARQSSQLSHTAAIYVILDGRPIAECKDAEYWAIYADYYKWKLNEETSEFLRAECCDTPEIILADFAEARKVFSAIRDYAHDDTPKASTRHGRSTYACRGPIAIGVKSYSGIKRTLYCFNAPPNTSGVLQVGTTLLSSPDPASPWSYLSNIVQTFPVGSNEAGFIEQTVNVPSPLPASQLYYQYVWNGDCEDPNTTTASDVIKIPVLGTF